MNPCTIQHITRLRVAETSHVLEDNRQCQQEDKAHPKVSCKAFHARSSLNVVGVRFLDFLFRHCKSKGQQHADEAAERANLEKIFHAPLKVFEFFHNVFHVGIVRLQLGLSIQVAKNPLVISELVFLELGELALHQLLESSQ